MTFENIYDAICPPWENSRVKFEKLVLASEIMDATFDYFSIERNIKIIGRPPLDLKNMMKLIHLCSVEKIEDSEVIVDKAERDPYYIALCGGVKPKARTVRDYKVIYGLIEQLVISFTLIFSRKMNFSKFKHLSGDGTIKLACNSPFNIIKKKDIRLLIKHYMVEKLTKEELKKLRRSAKKFLNNNKISYEDKIEILFGWYDKLDLTGQISIPLYDEDARLMQVKYKGQIYKKWAYNIQVCTDTESKLICAVNVVQYPTDHYQIPALMDQAIENLEITPEILSADNIYRTLGNLYYLKEHNISARIPTKRQSREMMGKLSSNPFHRDHFEYDEKKNVVICPEKNELTQHGESFGKTQKGGFRYLKKTYYNEEACKNCPNKKKCTKSKYKKIVIEYNELTDEVEKIMDTEQGKLDYSHRMKTVESHNGTFKNIYKYDTYKTRGLKRVQALMFRIVAAYNTIRIYNIAHDKGIDFYKLIECVRLVGSRKDDEIIMEKIGYLD